MARLAEACGLSKGMLSKIENAQAAPSLGTLARLAEALPVPFTAFFRGLPEEQDIIFVKAGAGLIIEHRNSGAGHRYQTLGTMRAPHDRLEPMLVTLTARTEADAFPLYQHAGTELVFMISGKMEYCCGNARYVLEPGDTIQFVGDVPHGPGDLITLPIQFLAVKALGPRTKQVTVAGTPGGSGTRSRPRVISRSDCSGTGSRTVTRRRARHDATCSVRGHRRWDTRSVHRLEPRPSAAGEWAG